MGRVQWVEVPKYAIPPGMGRNIKGGIPLPPYPSHSLPLSLPPLEKKALEPRISDIQNGAILSLVGNECNGLVYSIFQKLYVLGTNTIKSVISSHVTC